MFRSAATMTAVVLAAKVLTGCGFDCNCPPGTWRPIVSGRWSAAASAASTTTTFPHDNTAQTLEVNRAAGTVQITRREGGVEVVERWRIRPR